MYKDISTKRSPHNIIFSGAKSDTTYNKKDYKIMLYELSITKEMVCKPSMDKGVGEKIHQNVNSGNMWVVGFWVNIILFVLFLSL